MDPDQARRVVGPNLGPNCFQSLSADDTNKHVELALKTSSNIASLTICCFTSQVNSYGHGGTVSSPNHTFSWASLNKQLTSNLWPLGVDPD